MQGKGRDVLARDIRMSTNKTVSISLPSAQLRRAERLAHKENRTMSELVREALQRYEADMASDAGARDALSGALKAVQEDAARQGVDCASARKINAEIAATRRARPRPASSRVSA